MRRIGESGWRWMVATVVVVGCGGPKEASQMETAAKSEPVLLIDGAVSWPTVSPDGQRLAYEVAENGDSDIRVMRLDGSSPRTLLDGEANDRRPAWSPTGDSIAFVSDRGEGPGIWIAASDGSGARLVYDSDGIPITGPDWSPDGTQLAFSQVDPSGAGNISYGRATVWSVSVADGEAREHTTRGDEWWPAWTHDGRELVYYVGNHDELEAVDVETDSVRVLWNGRMVGWLPDLSPVRAEVAFISDMDAGGMWIAGLEEDAAPELIVRAGDPTQPNYLPDGSGLVFTMDTAVTHIVRADLSSGTQDTLVAGGRMPRPLPDGGFAYLPDGARGRRIIVVRDGVPDTLETPIGALADFGFSPDGSWLAATKPSPGDARYDLYVMDASTLRPRRLTEVGDIFRFVWCGDSESFVVSSSTDKRANRRRTLWSVDRTAGGLTGIDVGSYEASLGASDCSGSGDLLFELRLGGAGAYVARADRSGYQVEPLGPGRMSRWSPDGSRIAFIDEREGRTDVFVREVDGSVTRVTDDSAVEAEVQWSADGNALLFDRVTPSRGIWLIRF